MRTTRTKPSRRRAEQIVLCLFLGLSAAYAGAHAAAPHGHMPSDASKASLAMGPPPVFVATTAKSFSELMGDSMVVMDDGMQRAPMNGQVDHDFNEMMIPHHQGAIDMAKAVLLYTDDPEIRNIALGIITEQQTEINVMQAWLKSHGG